MKTTALQKSVTRIPALLVVMLLLSSISQAQTFFGVASNPADNGSVTTATVAVTPPGSMLAGDLVVIYAHYRATSATLSISEAGGQTWTSETANSGGTQTSRIFWCRYNGTWSANPSVTGGASGTPLSVIMYVYRPTNSSNAWDVHIAQSNAGVTNTAVSITGVTTTVPNTVTMGFWSSAAANTWGTLTGAGWYKTGLANQYRNLGGSDQSHTAAYNIQTAAATVPNVSQTQSSSLSTRTSIITWYEFSPPPPPVNDECAGAITLPVNGSCSNVSGTVVSSTPSATSVAPCTGPVGYDVWYKFTAVNTTATITISGLGANFTNSRLQLFSGSCGSLTSIFCGTTSIAATGLTAGATYYIRVYSTSASIPYTNGNFNICISTSTPPPRHGNSYVNISKKTAGGVVEPGDTLEIRMTINHRSGTLYRMRYVDNIPTNTAMLTGVNDSIRVITNEGLTYQKYTLAAGDDAATYLASPGPGEYNIRLNLGFGTTPPATIVNNTETEFTSAVGEMIAGSNRPRGGGGMLFATAYRVVVTGNVGDTIRLNAGKFIYRTSLGGLDIALTAVPYEILISDPMSLCTNSTGINNAQEFGGTFGSGSTLNRSTDLGYPIPGYTFVNASATQSVGDGQYAIVKNTSPRSGTNRYAERTPNCPTALPSQDACANRMHNGHWDIDGDHTGTNNAIGNLPPAPTQAGGYMLMVNADYVASEAFRQTITNLCPNTYYEFSAWIRNICPTCGIDSTGTTYTPRRPGVLPNLTFSLDGVDRYSTGEVDTVGWVKKGFVFITGPTQTSATFSIRNNSQGGGGNDWVLDDISIATCLPNMQYSPTMTPTVCEGNTITVYDTIRSYFNNYTYYKWQRSTDNGSSWTDLTGEMGPVTPTWNGTAWEYITSWVIPPGSTSVSDSGDLYRVLVATTSANLSNSSCQVTDEVSIITLQVQDCGIPLKTELLSFYGKIVNGLAALSWITSKEEKPVNFSIEKSYDGIHFINIGSLRGYNNRDSERNTYTFTDPQNITQKVWYRIVLLSSDNRKYSRIIQLTSEQNDFFVRTITNPFKNELVFDVVLTSDSRVEVALTDLFGNLVRRKNYGGHAGTNSYSLENTIGLPTGIYILQVRNKDRILTRKVLKN